MSPALNTAWTVATCMTIGLAALLGATSDDVGTRAACAAVFFVVMLIMMIAWKDEGD